MNKALKDMSDIELDEAFENCGGWQDKKEDNILAEQVLLEKERRKKNRNE